MAPSYGKVIKKVNFAITLHFKISSCIASFDAADDVDDGVRLRRNEFPRPDRFSKNKKKLKIIKMVNEYAYNILSFYALYVYIKSS